MQKHYGPQNSIFLGGSTLNFFGDDLSPNLWTKSPPLLPRNPRIYSRAKSNIFFHADLSVWTRCSGIGEKWNADLYASMCSKAGSTLPPNCTAASHGVIAARGSSIILASRAPRTGYDKASSACGVESISGLWTTASG